MHTTSLPDACQSTTVRIVASVFDSMLGMDALVARAAWPPAEPAITAEVRYSGAWQGALSISLPPLLACEIAGRLMPGAHPLEMDADVLDAVGELANMVGGNLKALLPCDTGLSWPSVESGVCALSNAQAKFAVRLSFTARTAAVPHGLFWVSVLEL